MRVVEPGVGSREESGGHGQRGHRPPGGVRGLVASSLVASTSGGIRGVGFIHTNATNARKNPGTKSPDNSCASPLARHVSMWGSSFGFSSGVTLLGSPSQKWPLSLTPQGFRWPAPWCVPRPHPWCVPRPQGVPPMRIGTQLHRPCRGTREHPDPKVPVASGTPPR